MTFKRFIAAILITYTEAIRTSAHAGGCNGNDCGGYVHTLVRASGWDPTYSDGNTTGQYDYMTASSKWDDITSKVHSNKDAKPGDVIIFKRGIIAGHSMGHVLIYNDKIDGFGNVMSSVSYCNRAPMADSASDISHYVNQGYHVFRLKSGN